jgi:putative ABC transport system ATP-binding protein
MSREEDGCARRAGQDFPLETNLFRYIWLKSRAEQIVVLVIILVSIPFYWASFDVPKRIVNDAIQGGAFKDGKTTATLLDFTLHMPGWLGAPATSCSRAFRSASSACCLA